MRYRIFTVILFSVLLLSSCKSQYDALLESDDVDLKYKTAFELYGQKKYSKSATLFESLKLATKGTLQDDTVQFYTGLSHYKFGDIYAAEPCFESFLNVFPRSPFAEEAKYLRIDCLYQQTLRWELDQMPTYKALSVINEFITEHPNSSYMKECKEMVSELNERIDRKAFEAAKLYYTTEEYKSANYALKNVLKQNADNIYREDIMYYTAMASYKYAFNSIPQRQKERYMVFSDDYYNFVGEFPESGHRRELDGLYKKVQEVLKK